MVSDVVIVGAGIVGAACAWECTRAGLSTVVIDRGPVSGGATAAGMGQIVVMDDSEAEFALTRYSQQLWNQLAGDLPASAEVDRCGTIWIADDEEEMQEVHRKRRYYEERGMRVDVLDRASLEKLEPNLRKGFAGGLWMPDDFVIYSPCATDWLIGQAQQLGMHLQLGETVQEMTGGGVRTQAGEFLSAGTVINAIGSCARALMPSLPVRPRKGH
jgi:glycine/D-amino acid oxidase-like deaminating enzyme